MIKKLKLYKPILFILPALVCYIIFLILPIFDTLRLSFFRWDGANPIKEFVGFKNYTEILQDEIFWKALTHNLIWVISTIVVPVFIGLILAMLITSEGVKGKIIFRVTYFMPVVVSLVAVGIIWGWMLHTDYGIFNSILRGIGLDFLAYDWLGNSKTVLMSLIVAGSWTYYGFCMVIFLAALQGIDKSYYEVAKIEGSNAFQSFIYVTIPLLKNTITLLVMFSLFNSLKVFDIVFLMTKGGPFHSSEVIATYMYTQSFSMNNFGYGSALAVVLAIIIASISVIYIRFTERS